MNFGENQQFFDPLSILAFNATKTSLGQVFLNIVLNWISGTSKNFSCINFVRDLPLFHYSPPLTHSVAKTSLEKRIHHFLKPSTLWVSWIYQWCNNPGMLLTNWCLCDQHVCGESCYIVFCGISSDGLPLSAVTNSPEITTNHSSEHQRILPVTA